MLKELKNPKDPNKERQVGVIASLVVNVLVIGALVLFWDAIRDIMDGLFPLDKHNERFGQAIPWVVNFTILVIAFKFRPKFAMGWISLFAYPLLGAAALGILFIAACIVFLGVGTVLIGITLIPGCAAVLVTLVFPAIESMQRAYRRKTSYGE